MNPRPQRQPQGLLGVPCSTRDSAGVGPTPFALSPHRPRHVTDALHALAETPGLTLEWYEREKRRILKQAPHEAPGLGGTP